MGSSPRIIPSGATSNSLVATDSRRMERLILGVLLSLALAGVPALADDALEPRVEEIERLAVTAHWRESNARIEALSPQLEALSPVQRIRIEFVRLRNLALAGEERDALDGMAK